MIIQTKRTYTAGRVPLAAELIEGQLFINFPDNKVYSKDNSGNIVCIGTVNKGGNTSNVAVGYSETTITTVQGQTIYPIPNVIGLQVFVNGLKLYPPQYTLVYPNILLATPSAAGDTLVVTNYSMQGGYTEQSFTGDGTTKTFTVVNGYKAGTSQVFINGSRQAASTFTATDGTSLVFTTAPAMGAIVVFTNLNPIPLTTWHIEYSYVKDQAVYYQGTLYYAQGIVPSNTPWALGSSGATWSTNP